MSHLEELNEKQREAALHKDGSILIIAGAGAGKTKTIVHRILNLIHSGVAPSQILAITFTNKAAKEMRDRVNALLSGDKRLNRPISVFERPFVSTFHSLGVHILRQHGEKLKIPKHFTIFDKADSKQAVKEALVAVGLDPKQYEPAIIQSVIAKEKGAGTTLEAYQKLVGEDFRRNVTARVWENYEKILGREKALDFDDLLLKTVELLRHYESVRLFYEKLWHYIHIDEYQDTNAVQYEIVKLLSQNRKNVCAVGDIDQNVYTWRGSTIKNILNFEKDFPNAKVVLLEENYRSTKTILSVANQAIAKNKLRVPKNLFTKNPAGDKLSLYIAYDEEDEARFVARRSGELIRSGAPAENIAVLYRANFESRAIEGAFLEADLPYQLIGTKFFERKEVKDILSYIKAALNPDSLADLKRIINVPPRGIGKVTLLKILAGKEDGLTAGMKMKIASFRALLKKISAEIKLLKPSELIKFVIIESGIEIALKNGSEEDKERLENSRELVTLAKKYDDLPPELAHRGGGEGIMKLLGDAALQSDQDDLMEKRSGVKLMTVHASKGLEFDYVFITGLEDGLFPHQKVGEDEVSAEEEEEERRLFYVALTRARKKIFLTYANVRTLFGKRDVAVPSEFVVEMDSGLVEPETNLGGVKTIYF